MAVIGGQDHTSKLYVCFSMFSWINVIYCQRKVHAMNNLGFLAEAKGSFTRTVKVIVFVSFKNEFSTVLWHCLHIILKRCHSDDVDGTCKWSIPCNENAYLYRGPVIFILCSQLTKIKAKNTGPAAMLATSRSQVLHQRWIWGVWLWNPEQASRKVT